MSKLVFFPKKDRKFLLLRFTQTQAHIHTHTRTHTYFCFSTFVFCLFFKQEEKEQGELVLTSHFPRSAASLTFSSTCCGKNTELKRKPQSKNSEEKAESSCPFKGQLFLCL